MCYNIRKSGKIAITLKEKELIRSEWLFLLEMKINPHKSLKAATYTLDKTMNLNEIIEKLENAKSMGEVQITFPEGERITTYAKLIADNTDNDYEDILLKMKDRSYIQTLVAKYWFLPSNVLDERIYYPLEGYLAPDTYYFTNKQVSVETIIETMLDEEEKKLEKYKDKLSSNTHYYMTMASIAEVEGTNITNKKMIVGIFQNRMKSGMNLGSDVTTYYGLQVAMTSDLTSEQFASVNAYNTRSTTMIGKMPIGPICNPGLSSIEASVEPTDNDYLFFVADKNGKIYYTKTNREHEAKIAEIKANGDWIW